jgi:hypothetical protein
VSEFLPSRPRIVATAPCNVARCQASASFTPILCVALLGRERVSRVTLPTHVCREHREAFAERFLTPERRAAMETSLRSHGRDSPDWSRTYVEFVNG